MHLTLDHYIIVMGIVQFLAYLWGGYIWAVQCAGNNLSVPVIRFYILTPPWLCWWCVNGLAFLFRENNSIFLEWLLWSYVGLVALEWASAAVAQLELRSRGYGVPTREFLITLAFIASGPAYIPVELTYLNYSDDVPRAHGQ